jgi:hypothetical protein
MLCVHWMLQPDSFALQESIRSQDAATMLPAYECYRTYSIPTGWRYLPSFSRLIFEELLGPWLRSDSAAALLVPFTWSFHDRQPRVYGGRRASIWNSLPPTVQPSRPALSSDSWRQSYLRDQSSWMMFSKYFHCTLQFVVWAIGDSCVRLMRSCSEAYDSRSSLSY